MQKPKDGDIIHWRTKLVSGRNGIPAETGILPWIERIDGSTLVEDHVGTYDTWAEADPSNFGLPQNVKNIIEAKGKGFHVAHTDRWLIAWLDRGRGGREA